MTLSTLPNELIFEIASHAGTQPAHSPTTVPSAVASDLAALTCLSKRVRDIALPILFRDIAVSCPGRLFKLSLASPQLLSLVRALTIYLDAEFFELWAATLDGSHFASPASSPPNPLSSLVALLSHTTSSLHSLAIRLSHKAASSLHYNRRTAIPAYPRACLRAVSLSPTFSTYVAALNSTLAKPLSLPALQSLHIDAADNVSSLLRLAPNLVTLGLSIPEGFSETACAQLVRKDLKLVPKLQSLALSPFSLRLPERRASVCYSSPFASSEWRIAQMQAAANRSSTTTGGTGVALVEEIAKSLPELHALDLQTTSYSFSTSRLALQSIPCSAEQHPALLTALQLFTRLRDLALPIDLFPNQRHTFSSTSDDKPYSIPEDEIEAVRSFVHAVPTLAHFSWAGNAPDVPESFIVAYDITSPSNEDVSIVRLSAPSSLRITATPITEEPTTVVEPTTPTSALSKAKDAAWGVVFSAAMVYSSVGRILAPPVIDLAAPRLPRRWSWSSKSSPTASSTLVPRRASLLLPVA